MQNVNTKSKFPLKWWVCFSNTSENFDSLICKHNVHCDLYNRMLPENNWPWFF